MDINWYPGHMAKARRLMQESLKAVDLIIEIVDARIPHSSRNPDFDDLFANKERVMVLNKADLADKAITKLWLDHYHQAGLQTLALDSAHPKDKKLVEGMIARAAQEKVTRMANRGAKKVVRAMVTGIPNVGKSTFINMFAGTAAAKASNRPGVTRGKQIIRITPWLELMDTPGVLWPKLDDPDGALHLALTGAIKDDIMNVYGLARELVAIVGQRYPDALPQRYKLEELGETPDHTIQAICKKRGFLLRGGELDEERAARTLLEEYRNAKLGAMTLETPDEIKKRSGDAESFEL
ncbi:MAG: ribosome biogenesis GTPase YlqF [Eubacteriales bacterium]|nr:ribosome biogenesis GTPase YlqF [Eubacteriales bacterium]